MMLTTRSREEIVSADLCRLRQLSQEANQQHASNCLSLYRSTKAEQTTRRQLGDLRLFSTFLQEVADLDIAATTFYNEPEIWGAVSGGLVEAFKLWMLAQGYAVNSLNIRLGTIKTYSKLAFQAGYLEHAEYLYIHSIHGFSQREARRIDERRGTTRIGHKKAEATSLTRVQVQQLKQLHGDKPMNYRNRLLMCLALDHGLRAGEMAALTFGSVDQETMLLRFYREKVGLNAAHRLTRSTAASLLAYIAVLGFEPEDDAPLLLAMNRTGRAQAIAKGLSTRAIYKIVNQLGERIGVSDLGTHCLRHAWATEAARHAPLDKLMQAGGWSSYAMPLRYIERQAIDNEGIKLGW